MNEIKYQIRAVPESEAELPFFTEHDEFRSRPFDTWEDAAKEVERLGGGHWQNDHEFTLNFGWQIVGVRV